MSVDGRGIGMETQSLVESLQRLLVALKLIEGLALVKAGLAIDIQVQRAAIKIQRVLVTFQIIAGVALRSEESRAGLT